MEVQKKKKPHAVCIPYPAQGHITPMMKLAKLLHHNNGFHITFVNTHFNHNRLLRSSAVAAAAADNSFRFESIPDGLPPSDEDATQDIPSLCTSIINNALLPPLRTLLASLENPPVTCVVSDASMPFSIDAAREIGVPVVLLVTSSACGAMGYFHYQALIDKGIVPFQREQDLTNCALDAAVDGAPAGMEKMRLRDYPSFIRTTDINDVMLQWRLRVVARTSDAAAVVVNTFEELEGPVLAAIRAHLGIPVYSIGPLDLLLRHRAFAGEGPAAGSSLWKEDGGCIGWLDGRPAKSVVYVNFGSIAVVTEDELAEFAWGIAGSGQGFLWVVRPDLVKGSGELPAMFLEETEGRGKVVSWCPQEEVLRHPAVGGFLTHCGWNSTMESLCGGVPMICWPYFADQQTNCRFACAEWGVGVEIGGDVGVVRREEVEGVVREVIAGEKGREMAASARRWRERAVAAAEPGGSSSVNFDAFVDDVLCRQ